MSEMVERVAKAIFGVSAPYKEHCCANPDFERCPCSEDALHQARAAIEAMREPTKAMIEAPTRADDNDEATVANWKAMIDAALA